MHKTCPKCGIENPSDREYCASCRTLLARTPHTMHNAWQAYNLRKNLGSSGIWSILWGLVATVTGVAMLDESGLNGVLIVIGLFLIGSGIAAWATPGPLTLRLDAISLLGVGLWNILISLANGVSEQLMWLGVGIVQIVWSIQRFRKYGDMAQVQHVPQAAAREVGTLVQKTQRANAAREVDVIEFRAQNKLWKARLMRDIVVAVAGSGAAQEVRFLQPGEFDLQVTGEAQSRGWPQADIRMEGVRSAGTVSPGTPGRYADWRAVIAEEPGRLDTPGRTDPALPAATPEAPAWQRQPQPAAPPRKQAAPTSRRIWTVLGIAAALVVVSIGGGLIAYRVAGQRAFARGEAAYRAGDFEEACPALDRVAKTYSLLGAPYAQEARTYGRECESLIQANADHESGAYGQAVQGYQSYMADYPAGAFVPYAQAGLERAFVEWSQALVAGSSYLEAIDVLGTAYAAYEGRPVPAGIATAFETTLYALAKDDGEEGQAVIEASWQAICTGEQATSQAVGLLVDAPARAWFKGSRLALPAETVATTPGHFRYAVCLEEEQKNVQSCSYMPAGTVKRLQTNWRLVVRDTLTGRPIKSGLFEGGIPDKCPATWTFTTNNLTGSIRGERPDASAALAWVSEAIGVDPPQVVIEIEPPAAPAAQATPQEPETQAAVTPRAPTATPARARATPTVQTTPIPRQVELEIWHSWVGESEEALIALIDEYTVQHPELQLTLHAVQDQAQIEAGLAAGTVDILLWSAARLGQWADQGAIVPLTRYASPAWVRETYIDPAASTVTVEDQVYGLPMNASTMALIYNRALLDEQDVPQTTDGLLEQAHAWTETDTYFVYPIQIGYFSACWFHGGEAYWADQDCMPNLDVPDGVAAAELIAALGEMMPPDTDYARAQDLFTSGQAPITLNGPWALSTMWQMGIDYGVAPLPTLSATGNQPAPYTETVAWMIGQHAADRGLTGEAWALIAALAGEEAQRSLAQKANQVPAVRAAGEAGWFGDQEDLAVFYAQAAHGTVVPPGACMTRLLLDMDHMMIDLLSGTDPAETVAETQAALEEAAGGE